MFGILAAIGNMLLSGIGTIIYKSQSDKLKPTSMLVIQTIVAGTIFVIIASILGGFRAMFHIEPIAFVYLVSAAIAGIIVGNFLYFSSLKLISVSIAYPIAMTYPLLTYILEIIILDGKFSWWKFLGIILIIVGVVFITLSVVKNEENQLSETKDEQIDNNKSDVEKESDESKSNFFNKLGKSNYLIGIIFTILATITWATGTTLIKLGLDRIVNTGIREIIII